MLLMDMIAEIRRRHLISQESISSIARDLKLSRPTVRKHCRTQSEPVYRGSHGHGGAIAARHAGRGLGAGDGAICPCTSRKQRLIEVTIEHETENQCVMRWAEQTPISKSPGLTRLPAVQVRPPPPAAASLRRDNQRENARQSR